MAHTPGPWSVEPHSDTDEVINVVSEYEVRPDGIKVANWICELDAQLDCDVDTDEQLARMNADAHLIAAAPDLLAACREFVRKCETGQASSVRSYAQMQAAIAKAEGRDA